MRFHEFQKGQRIERDLSSYQCYHCDKMGHISKDFPDKREYYKKWKKMHHAHIVEDEEPLTMMIKEKIKDYVLISSCLGSMSPSEDTWIIYSGASKNMKS